MGKARQTRKFAQVKRIRKATDQKKLKEAEEKKKTTNDIVQMQQQASSLFFRYNEALVPPYRILVDTNFINFSIKNKIDLMEGFMDCLYAKCIPCITDCVIAEIEKLGSKYKVALRIAKDPRFEQLPCCHKGTYADDCLLARVRTNRCYLVATCDKQLRTRLRAIPGIPLMSVSKKGFIVEQLPEAYGVNYK